MNHLGAGVGLLGEVGEGHRIEFTHRIVATQNHTRIFPRDRRAGLHLRPANLRAIALADAALGHKIVNAAVAVFIAGIPVLHGGILDLRITQRHQFHHRRVQLILIAHRRRAAFEITHMTPFISHDQRALKLPGLRGINSKIRAQLQRAANPFRDVNKRTVTEHRRVKRGKKVVRIRYHRAEVFLDQFGMIAHGLGERTENYAVLGQLLLMRGAHGHTVKHRIHRHTRQALALVQRHAEFVVSFEQLRIHLIQTLRPILVLRARGRVIADRLIINRLILYMRPTRLLHRLPMAERLQPPVEQPLRLLFLGRDVPNHILVQPRRQRVRFHIRVETPLVFLLNKLINDFALAAHRDTSCSAHAGQTPRMFISVCVT